MLRIGYNINIYIYRIYIVFIKILKNICILINYLTVYLTFKSAFLTGLIPPNAIFFIVPIPTFLFFFVNVLTIKIV